jgi:hypothetical protein
MSESEIRAEYMSTHAIKTELLGLLAEIAPEKKWHTRAGVVEISSWAVRNLDTESSDPREQRAIDLARVMHEHERSSK